MCEFLASNADIFPYVAEKYKRKQEEEKKEQYFFFQNSCDHVEHFLIIVCVV